jgi:hypothetical protein
VHENGFDEELRAMQNIAMALHDLDQPTRGRVLRWVLERFQSDLPLITAPPSLLSPAHEPIATDRLSLADETLSLDSLSIESLDDLFPPGQQPAAKTVAQSITGNLHDLFTDFQDLARRWKGTDGDPADKHGTDAASSVLS